MLLGAMRWGMALLCRVYTYVYLGICCTVSRVRLGIRKIHYTDHSTEPRCHFSRHGPAGLDIHIMFESFPGIGVPAYYVPAQQIG